MSGFVTGCFATKIVQHKFITASAFVVALGLSTSALASGFTGPQQAGGFQGPGLAPSSVAEALKLNDDTPVVLVGQIEKSLGDEKYLFKDASGSVTVEIDNEDWRGVTVTPKDTIVIQGEIDKDFFKTEIDVDSVALKK